MTHKEWHLLCEQERLTKRARVRLFESLSDERRSEFWSSLEEELKQGGRK